MQVTIKTATLFCFVAFLLGFLLDLQCNKMTCLETIIVKSDTVKVLVKDSATHSRPKPVQNTPPSMAKKTGNKIDSFIVFEKVPVDSAAIVAQYKAMYEQLVTERKYNEQYSFPNGDIAVESIVQGNELMSQRVKPTFYHSVVTNTVQAKKRNSVWIGVDGMYSNTVGAGASLMFQHKRGWAIEGGASVDLNGLYQYRASYKRKLSFK